MTSRDIANAFRKFKKSETYKWCLATVTNKRDAEDALWRVFAAGAMTCETDIASLEDERWKQFCKSIKMP